MYPGSPNRLEFTAIKLERICRSPDDGHEWKFGSGTGCLLDVDGRLFLLTNWHLVTGRRPNDARKHRDNGAVITHLRCYYHPALPGYPIDDQHIAADQVSTFDVEINTFAGDSPKWIESPARRRGADIVAIEVCLPEDCTFVPVNTLLSEDNGLGAHVGETILIAGYPQGLSGSSQCLPITKTGGIASSPEMRQAGHFRFLIDARTYRGMSGAPVFLFSFGRWSGGVGRRCAFMGIYSGRCVDQNENATDFGYCWHRVGIESTIRLALEDNDPRYYPARVTDFKEEEAYKDELNGEEPKPLPTPGRPQSEQDYYLKLGKVDPILHSRPSSYGPPQ